MSSRPKFDSRKATPWDSKGEFTPMEAFLKQHHLAHYEERHRIVADSGEAEMINSFVPVKCPYCGRKPFFFKRVGILQVVSNDISVPAEEPSCRRPERSLTNTAFLSVNGWNTVRTFSATSASPQTRGTIRTRLRRRNTGSTRCL